MYAVAAFRPGLAQGLLHSQALERSLESMHRLIVLPIGHGGGAFDGLTMDPEAPIVLPLHRELRRVRLGPVDRKVLRLRLNRLLAGRLPGLLEKGIDVLTGEGRNSQRPDVQPAEGDLDPPSPLPKRCLEVGAATARVMRQSPWRTALVASSSWSHAFLTDKNFQLHPDVEADRRLYEALRVGDYTTWHNVPLSAIEESGQQEMLNWFCLVGAMEELGRKPDECHFIETWALNSNKCFALFKP